MSHLKQGFDFETHSSANLFFRIRYVGWWKTYKQHCQFMVCARQDKRRAEKQGNVSHQIKKHKARNNNTKTTVVQGKEVPNSRQNDFRKTRPNQQGQENSDIYRRLLLAWLCWVLPGAKEQRFILEGKVELQQDKANKGKGESDWRRVDCLGVLGTRNSTEPWQGCITDLPVFIDWCKRKPKCATFYFFIFAYQ
jgi:hypothetical protein